MNKFIFILTLLIITLFPTQKASMLSCKEPPVEYIAICEEKGCVKGFRIKYVFKEKRCETRPVVEESPLFLVEIFNYMSKLLDVEVNNGIYQLNSNRECVMNLEHYIRLKQAIGNEEEADWILGPAREMDKNCKNVSTLFQISTDVSPESFQQYLAEWKTKEKEAFYEMEREKWIGKVLIIIFTVLSITWPWILVWVQPSQRKRLSTWLFRAVFVQALFTLVIVHYTIFTFWERISIFASRILVLAMGLEVIYLILAKIMSLLKKRQ